MKVRWLLAALAATALAPTVAGATTSGAVTVSAVKPDGVAVALQNLGYKAELAKDANGDPLINTDIGGWQAALLFYECNEKTHDGCQSLQLPERRLVEGAQLAAVQRGPSGGADRRRWCRS
jgi:hypothetical protein